MKFHQDTIVLEFLWNVCIFVAILFSSNVMSKLLSYQLISHFYQKKKVEVETSKIS